MTSPGYESPGFYEFGDECNWQVGGHSKWNRLCFVIDQCARGMSHRLPLAGWIRNVLSSGWSGLLSFCGGQISDRQNWSRGQVSDYLQNQHCQTLLWPDNSYKNFFNSAKFYTNMSDFAATSCRQPCSDLPPSRTKLWCYFVRCYATRTLSKTWGVDSNSATKLVSTTTAGAGWAGKLRHPLWRHAAARPPPRRWRHHNTMRMCSC